MNDVNKQLLEAAILVLQQAEDNLAAVNLHVLEKLSKAIAAAEQAQQVESVARDAVYEVLYGLRISTRHQCMEAADKIVALFATHPPAVAVPNGVSRAIEAVAAAIYFADSSDYLPTLWDTLRFLSPEIAAIAESDTRAAWERAEQDRTQLAAAQKGGAE